MIFYRMYLSSKEDLYSIAAENLKYDPEKRHNLVYHANREIAKKIKKEYFKMYIVGISESEVEILALARFEYVQKHDLAEEMRVALSAIWRIDAMETLEEITVKEFSTKLEAAHLDNFLLSPYRTVEREYELNYLDNYQYVIKEEVGMLDKLSMVEAKQRAKTLMADTSFMEEIERIYDQNNPTQFLGHPVHYKISGGLNAADDIARLLVNALYSQGRVCSKRINKITEIKEGCYDESNVESLIKNAIGGTVLIEMSGVDDGENRHASAYQQVAEYFCKLVQNYNESVLFIFIENTEQRGFSKKLISLITEYVDVVEIMDGSGTRDAAREYFYQLWQASKLKDYTTPDVEEVIVENRNYRASEVHKIFKKWSTEYLRKKVYKSYSKCTVAAKEDKSKGKAYTELSNLIGLGNVKLLVEQIIASAVVDKSRSRFAGEQYIKSRHMIFTGNPGSCKTTVARIMADTLKEEGILETGEFVECGRADLIGRYVGWTDKIVRGKFKEAKGGILFIDEAYSLVEEGGYYGDEAINTIVQEMENHRDDVIVIFAGYPEKMETFLSKNEGLRSRIAFHINFPDYNVQELGLILEKMMKDKKYDATPEAIAKAESYFERAVHVPEFGNGRFARNLFEQAMMKQSLRLFNDYKGRQIPKKELFLLREEDFEFEGMLCPEKKVRTIGFVTA